MNLNNVIEWGGGRIAQWLAYLLPDPAALGSIHSVPKIVDIAEVNQQCCLEESGRWLENFDLTHLGLASGKLVIHKKLLNEHMPVKLEKKSSFLNLAAKNIATNCYDAFQSILGKNLIILYGRHEKSPKLESRAYSGSYSPPQM